MLPDLEAFFTLSPTERGRLLEQGIREAHGRHFQRNSAYRRVVAARGVGATVGRDGFQRLLRPAAVTFKSYVETIGPFPQDNPRAFLAWLRDQLSISLPDRADRMRRRYLTLEGLLRDTERLFSDVGLEIVTSSGTSGIASVVPRDATTVGLAVRSFFAGIHRAWGVGRGSAMVFVMPENTRVAMARSARFGIKQLDWAAETAVYYTMPFPATPDMIRLRAGRTFRGGLAGLVESRVLHPTIAWADQRVVTGRYVRLTLARLRELSVAGLPLMVLGGLSQLHAVAQAARVSLPAGSRVAS